MVKAIEINHCTCLTKTPDWDYHQENCLYRISWEGYLAYQNGADTSENQYHDGTREHRAWMDGYIVADIQESGDTD